jgi:hypothetical protein
MSELLFFFAFPACSSPPHFSAPSRCTRFYGSLYLELRTSSSAVQRA